MLHKSSATHTRHATCIIAMLVLYFYPDHVECCGYLPLVPLYDDGRVNDLTVTRSLTPFIEKVSITPLDSVITFYRYAGSHQDY